MKAPSKSGAGDLYRAWAKARAPFDKDRGRERFLAAAWKSRVPRTRRAEVTRWIFAAAAAIVVGVVVWTKLAAPISFTAGDRREVGVWLATDDRELPVVFSEGTRVVLGPDSRGRVEEVSRAGAHVLLERGAIRANVVHRVANDWRFVAGPFEVRVTGTTLDVVWDPVKEHFEVGVESGSVAVRGPYVGSEQVVRAGERCIVDVSGHTTNMRLESPHERVEAPAPTPPPADTSAPAPEPAHEEPQGPPVVSSALQPASHGHGSPRAWTALEAHGDYEGAYEAVARIGLAPFYASASAQDLLRFAQIGKLSGHREAHRDALLACRDRFARTPQAAIAAFELGRSAPPAEAATWFEAYLAEEPRGSLAREAWGRLVEANALAGKDAAARSAAQEYLARYPDGPSAALARRVLQRGE